MLIPTNKESVMGKAIPAQHPAVVLRSQFAHLRNLVAVAMIAVVGLTGAVVILANDQDEVSNPTAAKPIESVNQPGSRFDGGPEEGTRGIVASRGPSGVRYDGGPEEGTRGLSFSAPQAPAARFDGGPEEGARSLNYPQAPVTRYDGGPEEGTRGISSPSAPSVPDESPIARGFNTD
jgi:hypothetical protein